MTLEPRLRTVGIAAMFAAFAIGLGVAAVWFWSTQAWQAHLTKSYVAGFSVHEALRTGSELPDGIEPTAEGWLRTDPGMLEDQGGLDGFFVARWSK